MFWADCDIKREGDGKADGTVYANRAEAKEWFETFCSTTGLPMPNLWVSSGYGLHLYWIVEDAITPDVWRPYAGAFKAMLLANGAKADLGCTTDSARVLRPPETYNFKVPANPQPVELLHEAADYPNELIYEKLQPYMGRLPAKLASSSEVIDLAGRRPEIFASHTTSMSTEAAMVGVGRREHLFGRIAVECEQVKQSLSTGGDGDPYPLWYLGFISLATFCADGEVYAHEISKGDTRYTPAGVDDALKQVSAEQTKKGTGAPTCELFHTNRPSVCEGCPHWKKITTPYSLGVEEAEPPPRAYVSFDRYKMSKRGLFFVEDADDDGKPSKPRWLSPPFEILAQTRDDDSRGWGKYLRWYDSDGRQQDWAMPDRMLGGDRGAIWSEFLNRGLPIVSSQSGRNLLADYLAGATVDARVRVVEQVGWHVGEGGALAFVLPDAAIGNTGNEHIALQTEKHVEAGYRVAGTVEEWRDNIGRQCVGNSRLVLCASAAFAAPLLHITGIESGGFHLVGGSQHGKTTSLHVGGSVWGGGGKDGFLKTWRSTSNGLEGIAANHCDALLPLDELGQADAREAGESAYMLGNGSGKSRSDRTGSARRRVTWQLLFLSSGEGTLDDKLSEAGRRAKAGQEVRLINIPANAGAGLGVFEDLHGFPSAGAFAEHLKAAAQKHYGAPSRRYLDVLIERHTKNPGAVSLFVNRTRDEFFAQYLPADASPQVRSVCKRFALLAAAGRLATAFGITGWPADEAARAAGICFRTWLDQRGSTGDHEIEAGIRQVIAFIEAHGSSRFENPWNNAVSGLPERIVNRAGFRRKVAGDWQYMILPEQWAEITKGFNPAAVAREMVKRKLLVRGTDGKASRLVKVQNNGALRLYVLSPDILSAHAQTIPNSGVTGVTSVTSPSNPSVSAPFSPVAQVTPSSVAGVTGVTTPSTPRAPEAKA